MWHTGWSFLVRTIGATKIIARDSRVPRPLRLIAAIGLLPIPGPVDEALLLLIAPVLVVFYRDAMREAWEEAQHQTDTLEPVEVRALR